MPSATLRLWLVLATALLTEETVAAEWFVRGDVDSNGRVQLADAVRILRFLFDGNAGLVPCLDAADVDDSGNLAVNDAVLLLNGLFRQGLPPPPPFPDCGPDPTDDAMACEYAGPCGTVFTFYDREFAADGVFFVIERSGAMFDRGELAVAKQELLRMLSSFPRPAQLGIVFFDRETVAYPAHGRPARGNRRSIFEAIEFVLPVSRGRGACLEQALCTVSRFLETSTARRNLVIVVSSDTGIDGIVARNVTTFVEDALAELGNPRPRC